MDLEITYRPYKMMGWNKAPGGQNSRTKMGGLVAKKFEYDGKNLTIKEWAAEIGIAYPTLKKRLQNMEFKDAIKYDFKKSTYEYNGEINTLYGWSQVVGISERTLKRRVLELNWTIERALETPIDTRFSVHKGSKKYLYKGKTLTLSNWSKETGINYRVLVTRIYSLNWSFERSITTPYQGYRKIK